ncbi:MAG: aminopeptidase P family protein [Prevotella sp.]|nr:aminopeptidase P family protein [Prevotella sp.]
MQKEIIRKRVEALRKWMSQEHLDAFIFPSTDPHNGEYVPEHWKGREWISGFNGSAGTAVVTSDSAALWTDSRYFIAAQEQLEGTGFALMRERIPGTPDIPEWLDSQWDDKPRRVGIDGMACCHNMVCAMAHDMELRGIQLVTDLDPLGKVWEDRPPIPRHPVVVHPMEYAGESTKDKICRIRTALKERFCDAILVTTLDDIAWTLNLRGSDVHCNPVFVAYLLITQEEATLFVNPEKVDGQVLKYLGTQGVGCDDYDRVGECLQALAKGVLLLDPDAVNHTLWQQAGCEVRPAASPIPAMKAVKNAAETEGYRKAMERDGVAMVKFLRWLDEKLERGEVDTLTEMAVDRQLTAFRAEQPLFRGISFDTIAGYGFHGAIVHYEATEETDATLQAKGFLLLDSGGQYLDGTTDITRTIALGPLTEEERRVYTLVLKGHVRLQMLKFPDGACGSQLDAVARSPLWEEGLNFLHGTGHGVGAYLNVHEGPHQIRMEWKPAPLHAGMTVTDEPGIYVEGKFGVRIENTLLIIPYKTTDFGSFLQFETLTLCPIDLKPVIPGLLSEDEIAWLNQYHQMVRQRLSPLLDEEHRLWLEKATTFIED